MSSSAQPIRVVLADDQTLVRSAFGRLIASAPDMSVVGEAATGREAVLLARSTRADLVLMDVQMPELDGIEATRLITGDPELSGVGVLVLTTYDTDEHVMDALRAGASGFLVKDARPAELLDAIRTVAAGELLLAPGPMSRLISYALRAPAAPKKPAARPRRPHHAVRPRTSGADPGGPGTEQPGGRGRPRAEPVHRQDACQPDHDQAGHARPRPTRHRRLRVGTDHARREVTWTSPYRFVSQPFVETAECVPTMC